MQHAHPAAPAKQDAFADQYAAPAGVFDEMCDPDGRLRAPWQQFADLTSGLGMTEFSRRWQQARSILHENGIAFSAYGDPRNNARPWEMDPWPLIIEAEQWQKLGEALDQRARLLNLILADLYGPQTLLARGLLPAEVVFAHPGFLRPFHGQTPPAGRFLHFYAADLGRSPDGKWWVLADRTEAPSGIGFALENRIVMSRMLPEIFRKCQVQRLAPYFIAMRDSLASLAPRHRENPRIALLSQGPDSPNFFEDAYIARYLGYVLVEGEDLAVRNNQVMLKTLSGLLPVDVLLRRPNSERCDALECPGTVSQGTAGMLQSARSGNVAVVNPLGTGLVESPIMMAFLPVLCRELLGEEPAIANVATWWCGDPQAREYVLSNLQRLNVRRAFRQRGAEFAATQQLSQRNHKQLAELIRQRPAEYVAQEQVERSTAPVWRDGKLVPAHIALRAFLVGESASGEDHYTIMRSALARVSNLSTPLELSILAGEGSKDVWVVANQPVEYVTLLRPPGHAVSLIRGGFDLPSRVADNLYWLGRHIERADAAARLLRTTVQRLTGEAETEWLPELPVLLRSLAEMGQIEPGFVVDGIRDHLPNIEHALPKVVLDEQQTGSLRFTVAQILRTAALVRDRLSLDSWRIVNRIDHELHPRRGRSQRNLSELLTMLDHVILDLAAFSGMVTEGMTRTPAYRFLDLGRRLERALQIINVVKCAFVGLADASSDTDHNSPNHKSPNHKPQYDGAVMEALLEVADSLMTYRARYLSTIQRSAVADLLLTDETNPRSLAYQLMMLAQHIGALPRGDQQRLDTEQRLAMTLLHEIRMFDLEEISDFSAVVQLLERFEAMLPELSDAISHKYLVHASPPRQMSEMGGVV